MPLIRIGYNHDTGRKFGNLIVVLKKISARFQLENWTAPARLDSARNFHSSGSLEPEKTSSNSSLTVTYAFIHCYTPVRFIDGVTKFLTPTKPKSLVFPVSLYIKYKLAPILRSKCSFLSKFQNFSVIKYIQTPLIGQTV